MKKKILKCYWTRTHIFWVLAQDYPPGYRGIIINFIQISYNRTISSTLFTKIHEDWVKGNWIFICLGSILTNNRDLYTCCFPFVVFLLPILTHLAYRANGNKLRYIGQLFTAKVCDSWRHWKMTSFMALDGVTSFLRLKDVTITCKRMRRSLSIGGSSLVQWRKVGRSWRLRMCVRR